MLIVKLLVHDMITMRRHRSR